MAVKPFLKKTVKIFLWTIATVILLLISLAGALQIPSVQNFVAHKATDFLKEKTKTHISLDRVGISFPKSIYVSRFLVMDQRHDTLLYAGELMANITMLAMLKGEVNISRLSISDTKINLSRAENDSTYNFNFLIDAFAGEKKDTTSAKKENPEVNAGEIILNNIRFSIDDKYGGQKLNTHLKHLETTFKETDLNALNFRTDKTIIDEFTGTLTLSKKNEQSQSAKDTPLPHLYFGSSEITNTKFNLLNEIENEAELISIGELSISELDIDMEKETLQSQSISLANSFAQLSIRSVKDTIEANLPVSPAVKKQNNWTVSVKYLNLINNSFKYKDPAVAKPAPGSFNTSDINLTLIAMNASDVFYSKALAQISIDNLKIETHDKFKVQQLRANLKMTEQSIASNNVLIKTNHSSFAFDANIYFKNLQDAKTEPGKIKTDINLKNLTLYHPEIIYFLPDLKNEPALSGNLYTTAKARIKGSLSDLTASAINVTSGHATKLSGNIHVKGLPDFKQSDLNVPDLEIESTREDVTLFIGAKLPSTLNIPESFSINIGFTGNMKNFETNTSLRSTMGDVDVEGYLKGENYDLSADINQFSLGSLLKKNEMLGALDGKLHIKGSGLDTNSLNANITARLNEITLNKYTYKNLDADILIKQKSLRGTATLKDEYAEFDASGFADFNAGKQHLDIDLNLKGADLKKLNLLKQDLRIACKAVADLEGSDINSVQGNAGITGIVISKGGKKYILDSLIFAAVNKKDNSSLHVKSAIIGIDYSGTFAPAKLADELKKTLSSYFPIDTASVKTNSLQNFDLKVELKNHPVISEVFLPELKAFDPGEISASYNSKENKLKLVLEINRLHYAEIEVDQFKANVYGEDNLVYKITADKLLNADLRLDKLLIDGIIKDKIASTLVTASDEKGNEKILLRTQTEMSRQMVKMSLAEFVLAGQTWNLSNDNFVLAGKEGIRINNLLLTQNESTLHISSEGDLPDSDINATIKNLKLEDLSKIIQKDTLLVSGNMNGTILLKRSNRAWGLVSDASVENFRFREIALGTLSAKASNSEGNRFDIDVNLSGEGNALSAKGYFKPSENGATIDFKADFSPITMRTLEAFSMGQINRTEGNVTGNFTVKGKVRSPEIEGQVTFNEVKVNPVLLNSRLYLKNETVKVDGDGFHFKAFTMLDRNNQPATVNGSVNTKNFKDLKFDLAVNTANFLLLNTEKKSQSDYYGTLIVDSRIKIKGTPPHPVITSSIKLKNKSYFTFAVPESKLNTDKGEGVVLFVDSTKFNRILTRNEKIEKQKSTVKNFDISSTIEIDRKATIKLLLDPASEDSLVVRGTGALSFALDPSGKITLTGLYKIIDGTYMASMENLLKRKFKIQSGSTIMWNGDPLDADININAVYAIRTSPVDLVADQIPPSERNQYRQRFPFLVFLKLKGALLTPEINFDIQLPAADRGAMNGLLHARLEQLKEDPSAMNKQVFALLVLGRFIQENPLETAGPEGTEAAARNTVGNFLSAQLNKFTSKMVPGVDVNFDVQSYDEYSAGKAQGRTEVGVGVSKQLFNDRVSVQVGGSVDVEGERAKQTNASDIAGDVTVEYKLTKDGRYRLKGFRLNQYEGALEGQIIQTGAGLLYTRDFETWLQLIAKEKKANKTDTLQLESKVNEE